MSVKFTNKEIADIEIMVKQKLGWTFEEKCGISLKDMMNDPNKFQLGKEKLKECRNKYHRFSINRAKINYILKQLSDPNWKLLLKEKLA